MYPIAVVGDNPTARAALLACHKAGFNDVTWVGPEDAPSPTAQTLPANLSRIVQALGRGAELAALSHLPDREQVRFASSAYLLSELPLGAFSRDRYGAPHVNIENEDLTDALAPDVIKQGETSLTALEREHALVLVCTPEPLNEGASHTLWHAALPFDAGMAKANITWLGERRTAWQFATPKQMHVLFGQPAGTALSEGDWHPSLHTAIAQAARVQDFDAFGMGVREHWYAGNVVYLGPACYRGHPFRREACALGLEDAWVLSRMMENYEEDIADALAEYQKYRRPRARRVLAAAAKTARSYDIRAPLRRAARNVSLAFSTRFMPEIAMQRIDWLYNYDCIRGFR